MNPYRATLNHLQLQTDVKPELSMIRLFLSAMADREDADPQATVETNPLREVLRRHPGDTHAHKQLRTFFHTTIDRIDRR